MGCFPTKQRNIQQKSKANPTSTAPPLRMQSHNNQNQMQTPLLISQLYNVLTTHEIEEDQKIPVFRKKLEPNPELACMKIGEYFGKHLKLCTDKGNRAEDLRECMAVSDVIVKHTKFQSCFEKFGLAQLGGLGTYMEGENDPNVLEDWVSFVFLMYLEHGYTIYSSSEPLFKALIVKFSEFKQDNTREMAGEVLILMLIQNRKLLKYTNEPYSFLQFWLYQINQQTQLDRQLYWIENVKKIYASDKNAENFMFYDNDFRAFIDLLVRVMEGCPDGKSLRVPLQCYLILSTTSKMHPRTLRLEDVKNYVSSINAQSLGISDIVNEVMALK